MTSTSTTLDRAHRPDGVLDAQAKPLDYHGMRMRHATRLVRGLTRRWGIYLVLGPAIFSAGSNAPVALASALVAALVLPLFNAAQALPRLVPVVLLYALVGSLPVLLNRWLWWPRDWAVAERALPLRTDAIRRSDTVMAIWMTLPWQCLLLAGCVALGWLDPARRNATLGWVACGWALNAAMALALSVAGMRWLRRREGRVVSDVGNRASRPRAALAEAGASAAPRSLHWIRACFLLPMWRGPARDIAGVLATGLAATLGCGLGTLLRVDIGWPLSALALVSMIFTAILRSRSGLELIRLRQAHLNLPIPPRRWQRARTALVLAPAAGGWLALWPGVLLTPDVRPRMLAAYCGVAGVGCVLEAVTASKASERTARWLLTLALTTAIAFEITPP